MIPFHQEEGESNEGAVTALNKTIPRSNSSLEARAVLMLSQESCRNQLQVYDWEVEGSAGLIPIPLDTDFMLCDLPDVVATNSHKGMCWTEPLPVIASSLPRLFLALPCTNYCWCVRGCGHGCSHVVVGGIRSLLPSQDKDW